jgi:hypothetical protein
MPAGTCRNDDGILFLPKVAIAITPSNAMKIACAVPRENELGSKFNGNPTDKCDRFANGFIGYHIS